MSIAASTSSTYSNHEVGEAAVYDAPLALDTDSATTRGLDPKHAEARNQQYVYDMRKSIVGPMPVNDFINSMIGKPYPGSNRSVLLSARNAFRHVPPTAHAPEDIYKPLVCTMKLVPDTAHVIAIQLQALNKHTKHKSRCPGVYFQDTARRSTHPRYPGFAKPHVCGFAKSAREAVRLLDRHSRAELGYAELIIQVTPDPSRDPFNDPPAELDVEERASFNFFSRRHDKAERRDIEDALGLHMAFVAEAFARQKRHAFYSISMAGSRARLCRWDRAGCVVTEAFDIREKPELLCEFLWRFSSTSDEARGHDNTFRKATFDEEVRFRDAIRAHVRLQLGVKGEALDEAVRQHYVPGRVAVVLVFPHRIRPSVSNYRPFFVSRPVVSSLALVGRCTWGYWGLDAGTSRVVFIKDTWRLNIEGVVEGDILWHLNTLGIRNVPTLFMHGDVPLAVARNNTEPVIWEATFTGQMSLSPWVCRIAGEPVRVYDKQRYRLVVETVGYGLATIRGTAELLHATYDAFIAMQDALAKDSRIHRDISFGNIILVREPGEERRKGYLIDWELSAKVDESGRCIYPGRAGTWLFMSYRMLARENAESRLSFLDDMESLVHVVMYGALRYLPHKLGEFRLTNMLKEYFEEKVESPGKPPHGGDAKRMNTLTNAMVNHAEFPPVLEEWLSTMWLYNIPQNPKEFQEFKYGERWTPEYINAYWSKFLETHELEHDNRVVHDIYEGPEDYRRLSTTASLTPPPRRKRAASADDPEDSARNPKRRRSTRLLQRVPAPSVNGAPAPERGPRRSQRIKAAQQPSTGGGAARARSSRSRPPAGRGPRPHASRGRARVGQARSRR
ncbi:hypothetical protein C8Q77DRAFT_1139149 [Trametes polyzona]|nr:hypothetical protein C8Q77DRAFT_1139149 [Trametes polyzona]